MLIDTRTTFCWETDFFGAAGTEKIGETLDLSVEANQGEGSPLFLVIQVSTDMDGGTSAAFALTVADNEALTTNPVDIVVSPVFATADAEAGTQLLVVALPKAAYKRYAGIRVTRVGTSTEGAISAFLTLDPPAWRAYPEGMN